MKTTCGLRLRFSEKTTGVVNCKIDGKNFFFGMRMKLLPLADSNRMEELICLGS